ncbi:MAG: MurR/RpiR family transcriptional regulator [Oscillospiraceae bacterium]|nr:MurR/RpiR family transcriptional regulator [Oscillospiraceae bacterium]
MAENSAERTVLDTITYMYDKIFQAEKKVADFILANPDVAVNSNVSELANHSGVSDATVIRLCKHLGYDGYYQMRLCLSRDIGRIASTSEVPNASETSVQNLFKIIAESSLATAGTINETVLKEVVELILNCDMVHLVAAGNTTNLCMGFGPRLERLGIRCTYNMLPEHYLGHINLARKNEVVLSISGSGTSRYVVKALHLAKEKGLKTVAVTGYQYSPVSRIADHLLLSSSGKAGKHHLPQSSHLSEMIVLEVLYLMLEYAISKIGTQISEPEMLLSESKF